VDHPALSPVLAILSGKKKQQIILADWLHHMANLPKIVARKVGRLWCDVREEVWFGSFFHRLIVF
jgi:hypothetical protein